MGIEHFPIPNLPPTMLNDVLKKLGTKDLINYSTSTEFGKNSVRSMLPKKPVKLGIYVGRRSLVLHHSFPDTDERDFTIRIDPIDVCCKRGTRMRTTMNFNGKPVLINVQKPKEWVVNWEKEIDGLIFMLDYLTELFPHMPICDLEAGGFVEEDTKKVIERITKQQKTEVESYSIYSAEVASKVLDNIKITAALEIAVPFPKGFNQDLPQNLEHFYCENAKWITRNQLLHMNYEHIDLRETKLQNKDISDLVNKIMNGDLPAFEFSSIFVYPPKMDEIVNGINYDKIPSRLKCKRGPPKYGRHSYEFYGRYDYERADGKVVSICSGDPISTTCRIIVFVWSRVGPVNLMDLME